MKGAWVVCLLTQKFGRARTGAVWSLEDAQRAALVEAQEFLDRGYRPLLDWMLSDLDLRTPDAKALGDVRVACAV